MFEALSKSQGGHIMLPRVFTEYISTPGFRLSIDLMAFIIIELVIGVVIFGFHIQRWTGAVGAFIVTSPVLGVSSPSSVVR